MSLFGSDKSVCSNWKDESNGNLESLHNKAKWPTSAVYPFRKINILFPLECRILNLLSPPTSQASSQHIDLCLFRGTAILCLCHKVSSPSSLLARSLAIHK